MNSTSLREFPVHDRLPDPWDINITLKYFTFTMRESRPIQVQGYGSIECENPKFSLKFNVNKQELKSDFRINIISGEIHHSVPDKEKLAIMIRPLIKTKMFRMIHHKISQLPSEV